MEDQVSSLKHSTSVFDNLAHPLYLVHTYMPNQLFSFDFWLQVLQGEAHRLHAGLRKTRVVIKQLRDTATAEEQVLFLQEVQPYR